MNANARSLRRIVANPECLIALGGALALAEAWGSRAGEFATLADSRVVDGQVGDEYLVLFDLRLDMPAVLDLQKQLLAAGASIVVIGLEPGTVQLGPAVQPGTSACLDCLAQRVQNNHRTGKEYVVDAQRSRPSPYRPLSPAAVRAVLSLVALAAEQAPGSDAGALPVGVHYRVRIDSLGVTRHRFIPVTNCDCCGQARGPSEPDALKFERRLKPKATAKRAANGKLSLGAARDVFVDRHCGLIKHVFQNTQSDLMPLFTSERPFLGGDRTDYSHGRASDYQTSELVAILEGVERYAGNEPRGRTTPLRGSYAKMIAEYGDRAVDPAAFILHAEAQCANPLFQLDPYTEDLKFGWVWGHSIRRGEPVLVPEQLAYYNIKDRQGAPANRFVYDSSNGCSLGGSIEEAFLGGLHEVVERDAYFSAWYSRIPPCRIDTDSIDDRRSAALVARSEASGFEVYLFDMTSDARIPVIGAMIVDPSAGAKVKSYCASACDGRWGEAIFSALAEVTTSMGVYRKNKDLAHDRARAMFEDSSLVQEMYDHVLLYSLEETYERLQFLLQGDTCTLQECQARIPDTMHVDVTRELQSECEKVLAVAADIIVVDQTFPELAELGLCAAKALVPGFLPVTFGHQYQRIDMGRLDRFARFRGVPDARFTPANVNPHPHNFP